MEKDALIYSGKKGAVFVSGTTKKMIMDSLKERDRSEDELLEILGKARSTISVHLSDLKKLGLVEERLDPDDSRKKRFSICAKLIGGAEDPYSEQYHQLLDGLRNSSGIPYQFLKGLFHLIRYGLISQGLDVQPALKEIGRDAGFSLSKLFSASDKIGLLKEISVFWASNGLGEVKIISDDRVMVKDCFDCSNQPDTGYSLCSLDEGLLEGIIEGVLGSKVVVNELECYGTGQDGCVFEIKEI